MAYFLSNRASLVFFATAIACGGSPGGGAKYMLSVSVVGSGSGRVTSGPPAGIDCGSMCSASLDAGSSVTLTAAPAPGSEFTGWSGSCSGTGACMIDMDSAKPLTARFSVSRVIFWSRRKLDGTDAPNANFTSNIWRMNADGTGLMPLAYATAEGAGSSVPQWSPDGSKVVFSSLRKLDGTDAPNANFTSNIWRANADGTGLMPLTYATAEGAGSSVPQWSPDGSKVVFSSLRKLDGTDAPNANFTSNIWRANADGTGLMPLTYATAEG